MNKHASIQSMFYEYLQNELSPSERSTVEAHLAMCKECPIELDTMRSTLAALPALSVHPSDRRPEEFWNKFATRITEKATQQKAKRKNLVAESIDWLVEVFLTHPKLSYSTVGGLIVMMALTVWTFIPREKPESAFNGTSSPLNHQERSTPADGGAHNEQTVPIERVNQYFRKSKMLLVGLKSMKSDQDEPLDFSTERRLSHDLIRESRYLKQQSIDPRSRKLMKDIEKILIELENVEEHNDMPNVEIIRGGIHRENLLFKIRMAEAMYDSTNFIYAIERQ